MPTNINPTYNPSGEEVFNTLIPTLDENADIQEAFRIYHYGVSSNIPTTTAAIDSNSMAGRLKALRSSIISLSGKVLASFTPTEPTSPTNGMIWVKSDSSTSALLGTVATYQNDAPTTSLVDGLLWVDKNSSPLKMYVYDSATSAFREIGA